MDPVDQTLLQTPLFETLVRFVYTHGFWLRLALAAVLVAAAVFGARLYRKMVAALRRKLARHMPEWLQILYDGFDEPMVLLLRCLLLYAAVLAAPLPVSIFQVNTVAGKLVSAAVIALLARGLWRSERLCGLLLRSAQNRLDLESNKTMTRFFEKIFRAMVAAVALLAILELFGVPVAGLLAGAGVAGLAVSLAAQSTLTNLIAGVTLVMERPFGIGDYVMLGSFEGTVEEISFRSTKLRTPDNCLITVENSKVSADYIQNVTNRTSRLWNFVIGVTYDATRADIEALSADLAALCQSDPCAVPGTVQVSLTGFGASSIDLDVRMYVTTLGLADFRELKNRLNLQIMDLMARHGCSFAFPSTSVYLEKVPEPPARS